ncbi:hypothetical protein Micbo1qcDRAFT_181081 [Microdochium bolleyi]|uniref:Uncharacterized protein n=1 Tax=Microdochium bolleyi TaxID=196109 RepID=A0A136IJI1_9PEZI|nr:hypothetical protein Micbo1qcDRAFT_181081 [Microdochium bolleyi]
MPRKKYPETRFPAPVLVVYTDILERECQAFPSRFRSSDALHLVTIECHYLAKYLTDLHVVGYKRRLACANVHSVHVVKPCQTVYIDLGHWGVYDKTRDENLAHRLKEPDLQLIVLPWRPCLRLIYAKSRSTKPRSVRTAPPRTKNDPRGRVLREGPSRPRPTGKRKRADTSESRADIPSKSLCNMVDDQTLQIHKVDASEGTVGVPLGSLCSVVDDQTVQVSSAGDSRYTIHHVRAAGMTKGASVFVAEVSTLPGILVAVKVRRPQPREPDEARPKYPRTKILNPTRSCNYTTLAGGSMHSFSSLSKDRKISDVQKKAKMASERGCYGQLGSGS